ncbi:stage II sporulation protein D [Heyndrickxia ginsengihumi]|uniref:Stage II sporulation protein D n=1 Tax=Heyndrickxia ginsengihumi TaxID=363870 RepID=A0A0A6VEI8_9BACI|nr:stage II sporulation protein D [Heyndrickxia ginsengihumi]KHD86680.1 stage II sporulation protein D [Heyndrickxia ginsengihumi]MBE6184585.1 stage II sporulation protein D [Bacillus sp. (in: firmicutes)]MCM3022139.1 stage II sporulation protein D [Heyndrickxia ginsengihumi]NEY18370.1 stage II sporulation protein D [Heyndrickxia ginsengihumi]
MKPIKPIFIIVIFILFLSFLVPTIIVLPFQKDEASGKLSEEKKHKKVEEDQSTIEVTVYRTASKKIDTLPMENYVAGVVAAEMPADFKLEALKAQALTARTFIVSRLLYGGNSDLPENADVTDGVADQAYLSNDQLKQNWGNQYDQKMEKINKAVQETEGKVIVYNGKPIDAAFFSTSNGYTENAEDYWSNAIPYLKSVPSPWDKSSPKFSKQETVPIADVEQKLGVTLTNDTGTVLSRTAGKRVAKIRIGGKIFTGREVREKLNLPSSDFTWTKEGNHLIITTKGYGHGVGMSQYGANGMAEEGKDCDSIIKYYYKGVSIVPIEKVANNKLMATK